MEKISNSILTVCIAAHGAELQSIKKEDKEYLWQGDARFWGRRSPVLFPNVGRVWNNQYRHKGQTFEIGQHGFARDMDFELIHHSEQAIAYRLSSSPETLSKYPFPFELQIGYELEENRIKVKWQVKNTGDKKMDFQIGAHPAFYFPDFNAAEYAKGFFAFNRTADLTYISPKEKGCSSPERHSLALNEDKLMPIDLHTFDCDTYMFDEHQLNKVTLLSNEKKPVSVWNLIRRWLRYGRPQWLTPTARLCALSPGTAVVTLWITKGNGRTGNGCSILNLKRFSMLNTASSLNKL